VNNAGGSRAFGKDATEAQWSEAMTLNFTRHRQLTIRLLPAMVERAGAVS
jgi:3-oxoacyl-[acyl-carrier protein] reductase